MRRVVKVLGVIIGVIRFEIFPPPEPGDLPPSLC